MLSIRTNPYKRYEIPSNDSKVKDLKRPVFAGYNIVSHDTDILTIDVLLSSPLLDPNTSEKDAEEYAYLHQLAESISRSELCISIKESALI